MRGKAEAQRLELVEHIDGDLVAIAQVNIHNQLRDPFFIQVFIDKRVIRRQDLIEQHAADRGVQIFPARRGLGGRCAARRACLGRQVGGADRAAEADRVEQADAVVMIRDDDFPGRSKRGALGRAAAIDQGVNRRAINVGDNGPRAGRQGPVCHRRTPHAPRPVHPVGVSECQRLARPVRPRPHPPAARR